MSSPPMTLLWSEDIFFHGGLDWGERVDFPTSILPGAAEDEYMNASVRPFQRNRAARGPGGWHGRQGSPFVGSGIKSDGAGNGPLVLVPDSKHQNLAVGPRGEGGGRTLLAVRHLRPLGPGVFHGVKDLHDLAEKQFIVGAA